MEAQSAASSTVILHVSHHTAYRPHLPMRAPSFDAGGVLNDTGSRRAHRGLIAISVRAPTQKRATRLPPASSALKSFLGPFAICVGNRRASG